MVRCYLRDTRASKAERREATTGRREISWRLSVTKSKIAGIRLAFWPRMGVVVALSAPACQVEELRNEKGEQTTREGE